MDDDWDYEPAPELAYDHYDDEPRAVLPGEWFLINAAGDVINACSSSRRPTTPPEVLGGVRWDQNPPLAKLKQYRYWDERP